MKTNILAATAISLSLLMVGCGGGTKSDDMGNRLVTKGQKKVETGIENKVDNLIDRIFRRM